MDTSFKDRRSSDIPVRWFWFPLRFFRAWKVLLDRSKGEAGVRCGVCDAKPADGETLCRDCRLDMMTP
jgi:hypothetical protein